VVDDFPIAALAGATNAGLYGSSLQRPVDNVPAVVIGDGDAGPRSVQRYTVYEDALPIPATELAYQGALGMPITGRIAAGRYMPLNNEYGPAGFDMDFPADNFGPGLPGPRVPQRPWIHEGVPGAQVVPGATTVYATASPQVGYGIPSGDGW
jgi:hypothetical protein